MTTSLGYCANDSLAAARAGLSRAAALPIHNFAGDKVWGGAPLVGHAVGALSGGHVGVSKILALGRQALKDLLRSRPINEVDWKRTGFYLNLSDHFLLDTHAAAPGDWDHYGRSETPSAAWRRECAPLIAKLFVRSRGGPAPESQRLYFGGHTGVAQAVADAARALSSGALDRCIVGGIDSSIELHLLESAAKAGMLKTAAFPIGFLPGEAACFILLERADVRASTKRCPTISAAPTIVRDPVNRFAESPPNGRALAQAVEGALQSSADKVGFVIGDLNGDAYRANDWGYTVVRLQERFRIGDVPMWLIATSFGEVGAATGVIAIAMATRAIERGYAPEGRALVWLSSDSGEKAALWVH
jgi:3-oxoacyl-[acyl-carrier-protein] synthase-1